MGHCQPQCRHTMHALLHSIQATVSFFLVLYTILASITLPTSFSPLVESTTHFHQIHAYQPIPFSSVCKCLDTIPLVFFIKPSTVSTNHLTLKQFSLVTRLLLILSGNVSVNPGPATSTKLFFSHINTRSCTTVTDNLDKPTVLQEFISDHNIDALALTETWLSPDTPTPILNSLTPPGYELLHSPRTDRRGGGLALIYRSSLNLSHIQLPSFTSFECLAARLTYASKSFILLVIYRPPNTSQHDFVSELSNLLDDLSTSPSELLIAGDFNIHVDELCASFPTIFLKISIPSRLPNTSTSVPILPSTFSISSLLVPLSLIFFQLFLSIRLSLTILPNLSPSMSLLMLEDHELPN